MAKNTKIAKVIGGQDKAVERLINIFKKGNIQLSFDDNDRSLTLDKYLIYYSSKSSAMQTLEEVFINMPYYFRSNKVDPFIVDAGSEVGVATIFFKMFYPKSKIICFEAHPEAFRLLKKNIEANKLKNVKIVNAALTDKDGTVNFFGEFDPSTDLDTRGSSIIEAWGLQRETSSMVQVKAERLSKYITKKVDFLKLNVEGAEQQILEDLKKENKIKYIENFLIKFHHSQKTKDVNDLDAVCELLTKSGVIITNKIQKNTKQIFPKITKGWATENEVGLFTLFAKKSKIRTTKESKDAIGELREKLLMMKMAFIEKEFFLLRNAVDNVPSSIYWKDTDGNYLGHSAYAVEKLHITNIAPEATMKNIIGKTDYDVFSKDVADKYRENDLYVMNSKKDFILEEKIITPEGKELVQLSSKKPLYDEGENVVGVIGSTIDITERKQTEMLEIKAELYKKQLEEQGKFKKIAGQVAHDIRSPLASLSMFTKLCKNIPEKDRVSLRKIAEGINDIANNLLNKYQENDTQGQTQTLQHVMIFLILSEVLSEKKYQYQKSRIKFDFSFDEKSYLASINTDPISFSRMISNLVNNAVEAIGSKKGRVDLNLIVEAKKVKLTVKDNGKGIQQKIIDKIMNGTSVTSGKKSGSGIGFIQIKNTLAINNSKMFIKSEVGKGTEIELVFPCTSIPDWAVGQINLQQGDLIIVIDDDPSIHEAWKARFAPYKSKIRLQHFDLGKEAVKFVNNLTSEERNKIFLLSDFELIDQKLNGLQIIKKLDLQSQSILVTSHYNNKNVRSSAAKAKVKILPKQLASEILIDIKKTNDQTISSACKRVDLVVIDDNQMFADAFSSFSKEKSLEVDTYYDPKLFLKNLSQYSKDTKICMDNDFHTDLSGIKLAEKLYKDGYTQLYLLSGKNFEKKEIPNYVTVVIKGEIDFLDKIFGEAAV